jgi:hypothetical protein
MGALLPKMAVLIRVMGAFLPKMAVLIRVMAKPKAHMMSGLDAMDAWFPNIAVSKSGRGPCAPKAAGSRPPEAPTRGL